MRPYLVAGLLLASVMFVVPGVDAVAAAVPGVSVLVATAGDPAFVAVNFLVSPDDTDQDEGDYTYNLTVDAGSGWVLLESDIPLSDGQGSAVVELTGATFTGTFNVTVDDGSGVTDSCLVSVDTGVEGDFDACGLLDPDVTYDEFFCLSTDDDSGVTGLNYIHRVSIEPGDVLRFDAGLSGSDERLARGALNLGGDTMDLRLETDLRFHADGVFGLHQIFFSTVNTQVGEVAFGNGLTTGAFSTGYGVAFTEVGDNVDVAIYRTSGGSLFTLYEDSGWASGDANSFSPVTITFQESTDTMTVSLGSDTATVPASFAGNPFWSVWHTEGRLNIGSGSDVRGGSDWCLSSPEAGLATPGLGGSGIVDFDGAGGVGGDPMFPGVSVDDTASALGLAPAVLAWILAALLIGGLAILGFAAGGGVTGGIGGIFGVGLAAVLNLIAFYWLVVLFLVAAGFIVLNARGGE